MIVNVTTSFILHIVFLVCSDDGFDCDLGDCCLYLGNNLSRKGKVSKSMFIVFNFTAQSAQYFF